MENTSSVVVKTTIVDDSVMYLKLRESGLRTDYYFNRKACDNGVRGHFAIESGIVVYQRPAPALDITLSGSFLFLNISGSLLIRVN